MSMLGEKAVRQAYQLVCEAARRSISNSHQWTQFVGMAMALGFVLEEPGIKEQAHELLSVLLKEVQNIGPPQDGRERLVVPDNVREAIERERREAREEKDSG